MTNDTRDLDQQMRKMFGQRFDDAQKKMAMDMNEHLYGDKAFEYPPARPSVWRVRWQRACDAYRVLIGKADIE